MTRCPLPTVATIGVNLGLDDVGLGPMRLSPCELVNGTQADTGDLSTTSMLGRWDSRRNAATSW